jgi:uncharacterized oxidoreductase
VLNRQGADSGMETKGNTVLITGGATGIGFGFAKRLIELGNTVIICGRRKEKLEEAKNAIQEIHTVRCDISNELDRRQLFSEVTREHPNLNILINNAGIQRRVDLTKGTEDLEDADDEIEINFKAQIHVSGMFLPVLLEKRNGAIVNVTSGLGLIPLSVFPVYSATKAAMHSFTISLRHQFRYSNLKVFEVIPPTVYDTYLKGRPMDRNDYSISTSEMTDAFIEGLKNDSYEITAGQTVRWASASKHEADEIFGMINH